MKLKTAVVLASSCLLTYAQVAEKCIVPAAEQAGVQKGIPVNIDAEVSKVAKVGTRFFGIRACTSTATSRLLSIQFYLKNDDDSELLAMPQVGPTFGDEQSTCVRRKLGEGEMYVDTLVVYESDLGIEAVRFNVGKLGETFGVPSEAAVEKTLSFTAEKQLVSVSGLESYTGIKSLQLSSLDLECVEVEQAKAESQARYEATQNEIKEEKTKENAANLSSTILVGFILIIAMSIGLCLICRASTKERLGRFNKMKENPSEEEMKIVEDYKFDIKTVQDPAMQERFKAQRLADDIVFFSKQWAQCPFRESKPLPVETTKGYEPSENDYHDSVYEEEGEEEEDYNERNDMSGELDDTNQPLKQPENDTKQIMDSLKKLGVEAS